MDPAEHCSHAAPDSYEDVPYPGYAYPQTHPDRLATLGALLGMHPAPASACRVLELGCGDGANLIPMAFGLPQSSFVGVDLSGTAIAKGQRLSEALGLSNISLSAGDLREVSSDAGPFDYIIAYGIYSWVPPEVRDAILATIRRRLSVEGVAFVSYNTYPGGHLRTILRDMMLYRIRGLGEPVERMAWAQALLRFLEESVSDSQPSGRFLKEEARRLLGRPLDVLYHDELGEHYVPVYFHEFAAHAARHGLQYLCEANYSDTQGGDSLPAVLAADTIEREQYLDFLKCRNFRQSLLCREEVKLDRSLQPGAMRRFRAASHAEPQSAEPDVASRRPEEFRIPQGTSVTTDHPLAKATLVALFRAWPRSLDFETLSQEVQTLAGRSDETALGEILLRTFAAGLVELRIEEPRFAVRAGERPTASSLARLQLGEGDFVTTLLHRRIHVGGALERELLRSLDGTRDRAQLCKELTAFLRRTTEGAEVRVEELEEALSRIARHALLMEAASIERGAR